MNRNEPPSLGGAEATLAQVRHEVRDLLDGLGPDAGDRGRVEGVGEAADGMIRVVAVNGRLEKVHLDPMVVRMPSADLADGFLRAANDAIDKVMSGYSAAAPAVDFAGLADELAQVETMGAQALRRCAESIDAAVTQYRRLGAP